MDFRDKISDIRRRKVDILTTYRNLLSDIEYIKVQLEQVNKSVNNNQVSIEDKQYWNSYYTEKIDDFTKIDKISESLNIVENRSKSI